MISSWSSRTYCIVASYSSTACFQINLHISIGNNDLFHLIVKGIFTKFLHPQCFGNLLQKHSFTNIGVFATIAVFTFLTLSVVPRLIIGFLLGRDGSAGIGCATSSTKSVAGDPTILQRIIEELFAIHPFFASVPVNVSAEINAAFAGYIKRQFPDNEGLQTRLLDLICTDQYLGAKNVAHWVETAPIMQERVFGSLFKLQSNISTCVFYGTGQYEPRFRKTDVQAADCALRSAIQQRLYAHPGNAHGTECTASAEFSRSRCGSGF